LRLPLGARLHVGASALVELTGLRTPCGYIDKFRRGLKRAMIVRRRAGVTFRAGVFGVVIKGGDVRPGDPVALEIPSGVAKPLPAI